MKVIKIPNGVLSVNTYFVVNETTLDTVIIDCGEDYDLITQKLSEYRLNPVAILLTHAHFDHVGCAYKFIENGLPVYISDIDAPKLSTEENLGKNFRRNYVYFSATNTFKDGDELNLAGMEFKVVLTPGHTDGSVCFITGDIMFSGDTLFYDSIGRTDFPTGSFSEIEKSIKKLYAMPIDYTLYTGHGENTTLSRERVYNMFIRSDD